MSSFVINVPGSVTVRSVAEFGGQLSTAFDSHADVMLDLAALAELDLSFVQLVHAARSHRDNAGGTLRLAGPANEAVAALLGRAGFLTDPDPADVDFWFHGDLPQ